jgi:protein ImuA
LEQKVNNMLSTIPQPNMSRPKDARLHALRARVRGLERGEGRGRLSVVPLGLPALDGHLPGGGLPLGALHQVEAARAEWDDGAMTGFSLGLIARLAQAVPGPVLWVARQPDLYGPGLLALGFDPGRLILVRAQGDQEVCWALEEGLRCPALAAVVGEVAEPERSAGRRLQLAAEASGITAFLLRRRLHPRRRAEPPSAAMTRWRVGAAPSGVAPSGAAAAGEVPLGEALQNLPPGLPGSPSLPGPPRWRVELLRCRGAAPGSFVVEGDDETGGFALATALRDGPLVSETVVEGRPPARLAG